MFFRLLLFFCLACSCYARTDLEIREWFFRQALECAKEHPVTPEELKMMYEHKFPETKNVKCLTACVYRRVNWIDSKGMFDIEKGIEFSEKEYMPDHPVKFENAKKLYEFCKKVNDEPVTDGEEGCDRSLSLTKCLVDNAKEYGFDIPTTVPV